MENAIKTVDGDFEIQSESNEFKGGFIVISGKTEINLSFPYLIQRIIRPATELEVAKILFQ